MRRKLGHAQLGCELLNYMPDHLLCYALTPNSSRPRNASKLSSTSDPSRHDPFIGDLLDQSGTGQFAYDPLSQSGRRPPSDLRVAADDRRSVGPAHDDAAHTRVESRESLDPACPSQSRHSEAAKVCEPVRWSTSS